MPRMVEAAKAGSFRDKPRRANTVVALVAASELILTILVSGASGGLKVDGIMRSDLSQLPK